MYKIRGRPEDPWNRAALIQEKDLAATIRVNQIRKSGASSRAEKDTPNAAYRQSELARRRKNYEEFKEMYQDRISKSGTRNVICKSLEGRTEIRNINDDVTNFMNRTTSKISGYNDEAQERHKPAMLRAPLRTVKTIKPELPLRHKEEAIICAPKAGGGESLSYHNRLKDVEKFQAKYKNNNSTDESQSNIFDELREKTNYEVDVSTAQLEEIKKLLDASKFKSQTTSNNRSNLYNISTASQKKVNHNKEIDTRKKTKFLLTLNNVEERIQKMQEKFFKNDRPYYKTVANFNKFRKNPTKILYKNTRCVNKKSEQEVFFDNLPQENPKYQKNVRLSPVPRLYDNSTTSPRLFDVEHEKLDEYLQFSGYNSKPNSPKFQDDSYSKREEYLYKINKGIETKQNLNAIVDDKCLKSEYLAREFDTNAKQDAYDVSELFSAISYGNDSNQNDNQKKFKNQQFYRPEIDYRIKKNVGFAIPMDYTLKNTLYSTDDL